MSVLDGWDRSKYIFSPVINTEFTDRHMLMAEELSKQKLHCPLCAYNGTTQERLEQHYLNIHMKSAIDYGKFRLFVCRRPCIELNVNERSLIKKNSKQHYHCFSKSCSKLKFSDELDLIAHFECFHPNDCTPVEQQQSISMISAGEAERKLRKGLEPSKSFMDRSRVRFHSTCLIRTVDKELSAAENAAASLGSCAIPVVRKRENDSDDAEDFVTSNDIHLENPSDDKQTLPFPKKLSKKFKIELPDPVVADIPLKTYRRSAQPIKPVLKRQRTETNLSSMKRGSASMRVGVLEKRSFSLRKSNSGNRRTNSLLGENLAAACLVEDLGLQTVADLKKDSV